MGAAKQVPELEDTFLLHAVEPVLRSLVNYLEAVDEPGSMSAREIRMEAERLILNCLGLALADLLIRNVSPDRGPGSNRLFDRAAVHVREASSSPASDRSSVRKT